MAINRDNFEQRAAGKKGEFSSSDWYYNGNSETRAVTSSRLFFASGAAQQAGFSASDIRTAIQNENPDNAVRYLRQMADNIEEYERRVNVGMKEVRDAHARTKSGESDATIDKFLGYASKVSTQMRKDWADYEKQVGKLVPATQPNFPKLKRTTISV
jgi:hypothetical protein